MCLLFPFHEIFQFNRCVIRKLLNNFVWYLTTSTTQRLIYDDDEEKMGHLFPVYGLYGLIYR